jgi:hypothetical protein
MANQQYWSSAWFRRPLWTAARSPPTSTMSPSWAVTGTTLRQTPAMAVPVSLTQVPGDPNLYLATVTRPTFSDMPFNQQTLTFSDTSGIAIGATLFSLDPKNQKFFPAGATVTEITPQTVTVNKNLPYVPAGTVCSFIFPPYNINIPWSTNPTTASIPPINTNKKASAPSNVLTFDSAAGVFFGMTVTGSPNIPVGTAVVKADQTSVTLSSDITGGDIPKKTPITFSFTLATQIVQHAEFEFGFSLAGFNVNYVVTPSSVATAVIPLNNLPPPPPAPGETVASRPLTISAYTLNDENGKEARTISDVVG